MRFVVLGNPDNRRVTLFQQALAAEGQTPALVISWLTFLRDPSVLDLDDGPLTLRIDSCGESSEVELELLRFGRHPGGRALEHGEVFEPRVQHQGFLKALGEIERRLRPQWTVLNPPSEIAEFFDKRVTSRRFHAAGIPVPEFMDAPAGSRELIAQMNQRNWAEAFVKLSCGSSASCLALVTLDRNGVRVRTSLERAGGRWFNNLKLRDHRRPADIARALDFILSQGAQVERGVPKAQLNGAFFDCRVLCVAGEPAFTVVRQNQHPITNLHLGGFRGDLQALQNTVSTPVWDAAMDSCRKVAGFYRSLHVGLDLMFHEDLQSHRILEANAFGDLLPNLTREGRDVYRWEIKAVLEAKKLPRL